VEDLKVRLRKAEHELNALGNTAQPGELGGGHGAHSDADGYGGQEEGADDGNTLAAKRRQLFAQLKAKVWGYLDARSVLLNFGVGHPGCATQRLSATHQVFVLCITTTIELADADGDGRALAKVSDCRMSRDVAACSMPAIRQCSH
jgi:hypothetical protein